MKILFQVTKTDSKNEWVCPASKDDAGFSISKRVASVLPASVLKVKGGTAVLYGTPEVAEVFSQDDKGNKTTSAGFRLVGVSGSIVDELYLLESKAEGQLASAKAMKELTEI